MLRCDWLVTELRIALTGTFAVKVENVINTGSFWFCFVFFFRAASTACGSSQARAGIRAAAAGHSHSHSNTTSKPCI